MTFNRFIQLMVNRPRIQDTFHITKHLLYLPEFFVLESHLGSRQGGTGSQHPLAIKAFFFLDLCLIDGNRVSFNG